MARVVGVPTPHIHHRASWVVGQRAAAHPPWFTAPTATTTDG